MPHPPVSARPEPEIPVPDDLVGRGRHALGRAADPYRDGLGPARAGAPTPLLVAEPGLVVEDRASGFCGAVVALAKTTVTLEDRSGRRRMFPLAPAGFLVDGMPITLRRDRPEPARRAQSASGSVATRGLRARTARTHRIWVEGMHDAALIERVWGHDLRVEGIVVEPLDGLDNLPAAVARFAPGGERRLGVLADHLVPGSKESRLAQAVTGPHVLVTGHPYVDIWQAVRPSAVGIAHWPTVPRGTDWKAGVCRALGISGPAEMWRRVDGAVTTYRDLDTPLITAVERLIDFVTG